MCTDKEGMELPAPATVTLLELNQGADPLSGWVRNRSHRLMEVWLNQSVPVGAPLKLEAESTLYLGEVAACRPEGAGFATLLDMEQAIRSTKELTLFAQRLVEGR
jgi:hypothetical protein